MTYNKSVHGIDEFDAIIYMIPIGSRNRKEIVPEKQSPHQKYIFMDLETPLIDTKKRTQYLFNNFYNWTMTYRLDSDILRRHGQCTKVIRTGYKMPTVNHIKKKEQLIAWFVSKCKTPSKREELVGILSKHLQVDIYGKCGNMTCPRRDNACY